MTDETQVVAEVPASEQVATVAPAPEAVTPETPTEAPKTFTQEELDAIVSKRLAREKRSWERQTAKPAEPATVRTDPSSLSLDQFPSPEAYAEALAVQKAQELVARQKEHAENAATLESYHEREEEARNKYDDFEQVAYNPKIPITDTMADAIRSSDVGPDIAYHLGMTPSEAKRIAQLPPIQQAREIGKIEAKLAAAPVVKKSTSAPAPITPVNASTKGSPSYDTTDPRSVKSMSTSEWIEAERKRQIAKLSAGAR